MNLQLLDHAACEAMITELPGLFLGSAKFKAAFLGRVRGLEVEDRKEKVMEKLRGPHRLAAEALGFGQMPFVEAEQVHGAQVAAVDNSVRGPIAGVDALITDRPGICLAIAVADCAAVYLAEESGRAIGLAHSGRKGTEANICGHAVRQMQRNYGCEPHRITAYISPCIRPPHYEVDIAAEIRRQLAEAGLTKILDSGMCTYSHPAMYYSYRRERGKTGRMLALLAMIP